MPYKYFERDGKYCVYKLDANGDPIGEPLDCHNTTDKAAAHVRALYASEPEAAQESVQDEPARADVLIESAQFIEGTVNPEKREVEVVLIRPGWSANNRYYSRDVLARAASLYEGVLAYADHPTHEQLRSGDNRSVLKLTGRYSNVRIGAEGELRATRKVYTNPAGDAIWPVILDSVENQGRVAGVSINAVGMGKKGEIDGRDGLIVEAITAVNSVDDVTDPAAGGSYVQLVASKNSLRDDLLAAMTFEDLEAARPDFVENVKKQNRRVRQTDQERAAITERDAALADVDALKAQLQEQATAHKTAVRDLKAAHKRQVGMLQEQVQQIQSDCDAARDQASRAQQQVALEHAFHVADLSHEKEQQLRAIIDQEPPDQWVSTLENALRLMAATDSDRRPVHGAPQRVYAPAGTAPLARRVINMDAVESPDQLAAIQKTLGG